MHNPSDQCRSPICTELKRQPERIHHAKTCTHTTSPKGEKLPVKVGNQGYLGHSCHGKRTKLPNSRPKDRQTYQEEHSGCSTRARRSKWVSRHLSPQLTAVRKTAPGLRPGAHRDVNCENCVTKNSAFQECTYKSRRAARGRCGKGRKTPVLCRGGKLTPAHR